MFGGESVVYLSPLIFTNRKTQQNHTNKPQLTCSSLTRLGWSFSPHLRGHSSVTRDMFISWWSPPLHRPRPQHPHSFAEVWRPCGATQDGRPPPGLNCLSDLRPDQKSSSTASRSSTHSWVTSNAASHRSVLPPTYRWWTFAGFSLEQERSVKPGKTDQMIQLFIREPDLVCLLAGPLKVLGVQKTVELRPGGAKTAVGRPTMPRAPLDLFGSSLAFPT